MTDLAPPDAFGVLTDSTTLMLRRLLPGPIERCWSYLADGEMRRQWLAAGDILPDRSLELVWRNEDLSEPKGVRPEGRDEEHRMVVQVTELEPPHRLTMDWGRMGLVTILLETQGDQVLLTLVHSRVPDRDVLRNVSGGWHAHLDTLAVRLAGGVPTSFWERIAQLSPQYAARLGD